MELKTMRPQFFCEDTTQTLEKIIEYTDNLRDEIGFRLNCLDASIEKLKTMLNNNQT